MTTTNKKKTLTVLGQADLAKVHGGLPAVQKVRSAAARIHTKIDTHLTLDGIDGEPT